MKYLYLSAALMCTSPSINAEPFNWGTLSQHRIDLKLPLLTIQGEKGLLACAYINIATCDKTGEACAIVSGVKTHEEMLSKLVVGVSKAASELGIVPGMSGAEALELLR